MKKWLKRLALLSLSLVLSLVLLEGLLTAFAWWKYGTIDVAQLERIQTGNKDAAELTSEGDGSVSEYYPHPYLTYVRRESPENANAPAYKRVNNVGLTGRDFPLKKDPTKFTILLTGGSVARQFGAAGEGARSYLEHVLNERCRFDREVVVLNGANSAWKEPQAAIVYLLYGDLADAVVTLDGFNEHYSFAGDTRRLEYPTASFDKLNPVAQRGFEPLAAAWQAQQLKRFALTHRWRTIYFATRVLRRRLEASASEPPPGISAETMFALPEEWSKDERGEFNLEQYKKYIRSIDKIAARSSAKCAHFIQPCPAIGKTLTKEEIAVVKDLGYRDLYKKMVAEMLKLRDEGVPIVDLGNVFESQSETIYADVIHCRASERKPVDQFLPSLGYRLMADAIAAHLAELWKVPRKDDQATD